MGRRASALEAADRLIGKNIRLQRLIKEALRTALASSVGVGEQQLQKYVTRREPGLRQPALPYQPGAWRAGKLALRWAGRDCLDGG